MCNRYDYWQDAKLRIMLAVAMLADAGHRYRNSGLARHRSMGYKVRFLIRQLNNHRLSQSE